MLYIWLHLIKMRKCRGQCVCWHKPRHTLDIYWFTSPGPTLIGYCVYISPYSTFFWLLLLWARLSCQNATNFDEFFRNVTTQLHNGDYYRSLRSHYSSGCMPVYVLSIATWVAHEILLLGLFKYKTSLAVVVIVRRTNLWLSFVVYLLSS